MKENNQLCYSREAMVITDILFFGVLLTSSASNILTNKVIQENLHIEQHLMDFSSFISDLCNQLFLDASLGVFLFAGDDEKFISMFQQIAMKIHFSAQAINTRNYVSQKNTVKEQLPTEHDVIFIFIQDNHSLKDIIPNGNRVYWNNLANFVVIQITEDPGHLQESRTILKDLWDVRVLKSVVISLSKSENSNVFDTIISISSFNPFLNITYEDRITFKKMTESNHVFTEAYSQSKTTNLHLYPLLTAKMELKFLPSLSYTKEDNKASTYRSDGYVSVVLDMLRKYMNYTTKTVVIHGYFKVGSQAENGTWTDLMGSLSRKEVDFGETILGIHPLRYIYIEYSSPVVFSSFSILVPKAKRIPQGIAILLLYEEEIWYFIITFYFIVSISFILAQRITSSANQLLDFGKTFVTIASVLFQESIVQPRNNVLRVIYLVWLYSTFVLASVYQGGIVDLLTTPKYYPDIDNFRDLAESPLTIYGSGPLRKLLNDRSNPSLWTLYNRYTINASYEESVAYLLRHKSIGILGVNEALEYYAHKMHTCPSCMQPYHTVKETVITRGIGIPFPKRSPFLRRFNSLILRMMQAGLINKWHENMRRLSNSGSVCDSPCSRDVVEISLQHLRAPFYILSGGSICASVLLIIELMYGKRRNTIALSRNARRQAPFSTKKVALVNEKT